MARRKLTGAEYIERQALLTPLILGDMIEHLGSALQAWSKAVEAARRGDLDRALTEVVAVEIACDVPLKVGRTEIREMMGRAGRLLDSELPDDDADVPVPTPQAQLTLSTAPWHDRRARLLIHDKP